MIFLLAEESDLKPVFGIPLATAVERSKSQDGIQLPIIVRECIDYIEENGTQSAFNNSPLII